MNRSKLLSTFLSLSLGLTSFAGVPVTANAADTDTPVITNEDEELSLTTTTTTTHTTIRTNITTSPMSTEPYTEPKKCSMKVKINILDANTGKVIDNVDVKVYEGFGAREKEVCNFNTSDEDIVRDFEFAFESMDDLVNYEIMLYNLPEGYYYENGDDEGWMMYFKDGTAEAYEGSVFEYDVYLHNYLRDNNTATTTMITSVNTNIVSTSETTTATSVQSSAADTETTVTTLSTSAPAATTSFYAGPSLIADYDSSPMRINETRKIRVYNSHTGKAEASYKIESFTKDVTLDYNKGDDFITVTANNPGYADFHVSAAESDTFILGCNIYIDVVPEDADIITEIVSLPDKLIYKNGEKLDISGLKAKVEHADGTSEVIDLSGLGNYDLLIYTIFGEYIHDLPEAENGKYIVFLGRSHEMTIDNKKYYLYRNADGPLRENFVNQHTAFTVYVEENAVKSKYVQIKTAKVLYSNTENGLSFTDMDTKFSIDAYSDMTLGKKMTQLYAGDTVRGMLEVDGNYVVSGDLEIIGRASDANCDDEISMADAVLIMQAIANPDKYGVTGTAETHITEQGTTNADIEDDGMTNADALAVQKRLLGLN